MLHSLFTVGEYSTASLGLLNCLSRNVLLYHLLPAFLAMVEESIGERERKKFVEGLIAKLINSL